MKHRGSIIGLLLLLCGSALPQTPPHPSVTLTWNWSQGTGDAATGFHVKRSATAGGPYTMIATIPVGTLTYLDTNVVAGATWFYVITAYNAGGESANSQEVSGTLPFIPPLPIITAPTVVVK